MRSPRPGVRVPEGVAQRYAQALPAPAQDERPRSRPHGGHRVQSRGEHRRGRSRQVARVFASLEPARRRDTGDEPAHRERARALGREWGQGPAEDNTAQGGCVFFDMLDGGVGGRGIPPLSSDWCGRRRSPLWVRGRDYVLVSMVPVISSRSPSVAKPLLYGLLVASGNLHGYGPYYYCRCRCLMLSLMLSRCTGSPTVVTIPSDV